MAAMYCMYDRTFQVNGNCGKAIISLVTGRIEFKPFGTGL